MRGEAVVAATTVLDVLMPHVVADDELAAGLVSEAAQALRSSLAAAGASSEEALEAGRRVGAEVARWNCTSIALRRSSVRSRSAPPANQQVSATARSRLSCWSERRGRLARHWAMRLTICRVDP